MKSENEIVISEVKGEMPSQIVSSEVQGEMPSQIVSSEVQGEMPSQIVSSEVQEEMANQIVSSEVQNKMAGGQNTAGPDDGDLLANEDSNMLSDLGEEAGRDVNITTPQQPLKRDMEAGSSSFNEITGSPEPVNDVETESAIKRNLKARLVEAKRNLKTQSEKKNKSPESREAGYAGTGVLEAPQEKSFEPPYDLQAIIGQIGQNERTAKEILRRLEGSSPETETLVKSTELPTSARSTLQRIAGAVNLPDRLKAALGLNATSPGKNEIAQSSAPPITPPSNTNSSYTPMTIFSRRRPKEDFPPKDSSADSAAGVIDFSNMRGGPMVWIHEQI